jgi:hypothetical protein
MQDIDSIYKMLLIYRSYGISKDPKAAGILIPTTCVLISIQVVIFLPREYKIFILKVFRWLQEFI